MNQQRQAEFEKMVEGIADEKVKTHVSKALKYISDAPRHLIVTNGIAKAREGGYGELALKLAQLAYQQSTEDPYFMLELCNSLGQPEEVVNEIKKFGERVDLDSLPQDQREKILVTLASAYKDMGKMSESIQILEESKTELARAIELLAEQYYQTGEPQKAIDLLYERIKYIGRLSKEMAFWLAKSFDTLGNYSEALDMLAQFQEDPTVKPIYDEARKQLGLPIESEDALPFPGEHPQPEQLRERSAEDDFSTLL
ncbi:MAG: hypothetical protein WBC55_02255 [Dehalococcoidia bacterium]